MPVEPVEVSFETSITLAEARTRILESLEERKGKVRVDYPTELVVALGSGAKTRLLGGIWVDKRNLPRDLAVSFRELPNGSEVKVTVRDTLCIGSRAGLRGEVSAGNVRRRFDSQEQVPRRTLVVRLRPT